MTVLQVYNSLLDALRRDDYPAAREAWGRLDHAQRDRLVGDLLAPYATQACPRWPTYRPKRAAVLGAIGARSGQPSG